MRSLKFYSAALLQNNFGQSLKSLEIRLFYRKLNSRKRGNSISVFHRNSPKHSNRSEVNSTEIYSNFKARETQDSSPLQRHGYKQSSKQALTTSKHWIEFTYSDFPCHFKVNSNKLALTFCRWKCKTGKRLTITANFQEQNFCTALSGKKNPARGPYRKKLDRSRARD